MTASRRRFLLGVAATPALWAAQTQGARAMASASTETRVLRFDHLHTGERLQVEYFSGGRYLPDALSEVNRLLRDFRSGDVAAIDPGLLDILHRLAVTTGSGQPFEVISGYRSPKTNESLRQHSSGVASGSLHMEGRAIDIRLADVPLPQLRAAALSLQAGGVGYYPASDFVHVDTGRIRRW